VSTSLELSYFKVQAELIQIFVWYSFPVILLARNKPAKLPSGPTSAVGIVSPKQFYKSIPSQTIYYPDEFLKGGYGQLKWGIQPASCDGVLHSTVEMEEQEIHYL
jgi:hypothetical protein